MVLSCQPTGMSTCSMIECCASVYVCSIAQIFYPDLIDKRKTPEFFLVGGTRQSPSMCAHA